jgi:Fe2+ or Zn2+ uptake regulation protein
MSDDLEIEVICRDCDNIERFESEEEAVASDWVNPSSFATVKDDCRVHNAYCPEHA